MFAFVIYDLLDQSLFIARDRFGIKPLYFYNSPKCFRAGSEIKQFLSIEDFAPKINTIKLYHYLNSGDFSFDSETMWNGVNELEPGHFIKIDLRKWKPGDELKQQKWYEPPFFEEKTNISFDDAACEFRRLLEDSVRLRLRSDVPVGFLLSGGIDSSTLVGLGHLMSGERSERLKTYSSCYDNTKIDEREYINEMLKFSGADFCLHFPKPEDIAENIGKVIWHNDLPVLHGSPTVHWLLYQKIKSENDARKVIIEGQGGDEIMCGYGDFHWAYLNECMHSCLFTFAGQFKTFQKFHHEPWKIIARKFLRINFPRLVKYPPDPLLRPEELLVKSGNSICDYRIPPIAIRREEAGVAELHRNRFKILRYILHNVDRNSMAHSREARTPFLDYRLVEFCLRLPSELKISNGHSKLALRKAAEEIIPAKIAKRTDKQGYSSPVAMWAKDGLKDFFRENLAKFAKLPFIDGKKCEDSFENYLAGKSHFNPILWRIICAGIWMEKFGIK
jgi:asparagine synthase (glutamine-hydrolysing)